MPLDYIEDKDIAGNAAASIIGGAKNAIVSTGADFLSTVWNSTVGLVGGPELSTQDILQKADADALSFYGEHREGVEAASFLAGIVAPQAATIKLLGFAKNGMTALGKSNSLAAAVSDVFAGTKAQALQSDLRVLMENAKYDTKIYSDTMKKLYAAKIGENVIDAAIFEMATVGALNAHPYMEDYMESPYSNFALWATVGAGIGGGLGVIQARSAARAALGDIRTEAQAIVGSNYIHVNEALPNGAQVQTYNMTIRNLEAVIKSEVNPLTKNLSDELLTIMKAKREERIIEAAPWLSPKSKDVPSDYIELKGAVEQLLGMPEMMGVDKIKLPKMSFIPKTKGDRLTLEVDMLEKPTKALLDRISQIENALPAFENLVKKLKQDSGKDPIAAMNKVVSLKEELAKLTKEKTKLKTVFYRPSTGDLYDRNLAGASALAVDLKGYKPAAPKAVNLQNPGADYFIETAARGKPSAVQDSVFLDELNAWSKAVKASDVVNIGIAPDNLARLNAATSWLSKVSPELRETIQFNITSSLPSFNQTKRFIESGAAGVKATHLQDIEAIIESKRVAFIDVGVSPQASQAISDWIHGGSVSMKEGIARLRRGFDTYFRKTLPAERDVVQVVGTNQRATMHAVAEELWEKGAKFRQELASVADANGNIRLYRGVRGEVKGASSVESFSTRASVSNNFGTAELAEIPVENIIGAFGKGNRSEYEILVAAPHHKRLPGLDIEGVEGTLTGANKVVHIPNAGSQNKLNGVELVQHYTQQTENAIRELIKDTTFAPEEIAARLNTTKEAVLLVGAGRNLDEIPNWRRYTDAKLIESEYLNQKNRIVALQGDPFTTNPVKLSASLDERFLSSAHQQFVGIVTAKHKNQLANSLADFYSPLNDPAAAKEMHMWLDQLKQNIGEVNNILVGSPFFQSVDNALRNIQDGPLVTYIGKRVSDIQDAQLKRILEPVGESFKGLGANHSALIEFNVLENKLLSLQGWKGWRIDPENGFGFVVQREVREGKVVEVPVKNQDGSVYYVKTPQAINALTGTFNASSEILGLHNLNRELRGQGPLNDLGIYLPPPNLTNKFFSYVIDNTGKQRPSVLYANTAEDLASLEAAYKAEIVVKNPTMEIVTKGQQERFNTIHGYMDGEPYMQIANNQLKHTGASATAIVSADARRIDDIMVGYQHQILSGMRKYNEMYLNDITQKLDSFSEMNQKFYLNQPLRGFNKQKAEDAAITTKNALLGISNLNQFTTWKSVNEFVDMSIVTSGQALDATTRIFRKTVGSKEHFDAVVADLTKQGIQDPWSGSFQLYQASLIGAPTINSKRVVSAANGLMGTFMLRFLEAAHPLVNAISLPILTNAALMEGLPKTALANGAKITLPLRLPMDAARFRFNPKGIEMQKQWEAEGLIDQVVRQFSDINGKLHVPVTTKGAANELLDLAEGLQNSRVMNVLSTPSDWVEKWTRSQTMLTGYLAAKHAYPGISDRGATIYAVAMADKVIGNYHAAQRPAMFQGTFGSVLGLFQTYMITYAQSVYRNIEKGQFKNLASTMAMQAGIFGTASWPGYEQLSKFIGEHMSQDNYDLTTGTYRAVGDPMAEIILYGLPSNLGPSLYTRGDIAPRIPSQMADLAIVNSTVGVYNAVSKMLTSVVEQPGFEGKLQGMMEGLSLQTLSRPIARAAEIVAGESITRKGQTVATSDDVWTLNGIVSRMLSVRPLEEQVTRNALNLHSYYGAADYDNRQKAVNKLRTAIRGGGMDDDLVDAVAQDYLQHGGSNKGWNAVMNEIMSRTEEGTSYDLLRKLEPNSPLRRMLKDTF